MPENCRHGKLHPVHQRTLLIEAHVIVEAHALPAADQHKVGTPLVGHTDGGPEPVGTERRCGRILEASGQLAAETAPRPAGGD